MQSTLFLLALSHSTLIALYWWQCTEIDWMAQRIVMMEREIARSWKSFDDVCTRILSQYHERYDIIQDEMKKRNSHANNS